MSGFVPVYDEESTDVMTDADGFPFRLAVLAAIEEVGGIMGDIDEGDVSGRMEDDPGIYESLEKQREYLEALTEAAVNGVAIPLDEVRTRVLEALIHEGDATGYIDLLDANGGFVRKVQKFLTGCDGVTLDDLVEDARDEDLSLFLRKVGAEPDAAPSGP